MRLQIFSAIALLWVQAAASKGQMQPAPNPDKTVVVDGSNAFAVALYEQLRNGPGNLFFSPESISIALAMTYAGARGPTAAEMARTLDFTLPPDRLAPAMGALLGDLNAAYTGYQLHVANGLWAQQGYVFLPGFLSVMRNDYGAGFNEVDFETATVAAREAINRWVELQTNDRIQNLIAPGVLSRETRLALVNAIYFRGDWQTQFEKAQTKEEDFHVSAAQATKAPLMHSERGFNYLDGGTFQALEIPYKSGELSMIVFLPNALDGLQAMEQAMTASKTKPGYPLGTPAGILAKRIGRDCHRGNALRLSLTRLRRLVYSMPVVNRPMADNPARDLFPGALEMMILESLRGQPAHGYAGAEHPTEIKQPASSGRGFTLSGAPAAAQGKAGQSRVGTVRDE